MMEQSAKLCQLAAAAGTQARKRRHTGRGKRDGRRALAMSTACTRKDKEKNNNSKEQRSITANWIQGANDKGHARI